MKHTKQNKSAMKNFADVSIGQTFYMMTGQPCRKISELKAVSLVPELCGFDFQEAKFDVELSVSPQASVYGIGN